MFQYTGAKRMGQMSTLKCHRFSIHQADPVKENHFGTESYLQMPRQIWIGADQFRLQYLTCDFFLMKPHFLSQADQVLGGLREAGIFNESAQPGDRLEISIIDQFAERAADRVAAGYVDITQFAFGGEAVAGFQLTRLDLVQNGL